MKKLLSIILTAAMLLPTAAIAENDNIKVYLDGERIEFDVQPIIENERTLVPMRAIFEALGAEVKWIEESQHVVASKLFAGDDGKKCVIGTTFQIDNKEMTKIIGEADTLESGKESEKCSLELPFKSEKISLDVPAKLIDGRTLVPLRAVLEAFDCDVQWDGDNKTVTITSKDSVAEPTYTEKFMSQLPQDENYVISPFSLKMAMMMAANGAEDETQKEILDAFGVTDINAFNEQAKQLITDLNADDKAEVNIANSIWFNKDVGGKNGDFADSFRKLIEDNYFGTAQAVTNKNSVEKVNEWTEKQTNGKIKNLLGEDNREYLAALVNAVYMKAKWMRKFEKTATRKDTFTDINGKENEIDFMSQTSHLQYFENNNTQIVRLPYTNGMSMYVVLGDTENFENNIKRTLNRKVHVTIPKFKIEYSSGLKDILKSMGVERAFEDNAQFASMIPEIPAKIDNVLQKAIIEVDEDGTEAAAATAVIMEKATSAMPQPEEIVEFKADKPFTYYIVDNKYNEVLFAGRYVKCD